jgi:hypothetical protein
MEQMANRETLEHERIGDQPPVAAPPERLGAHDSEGLARNRSSLERR